MRSATDATVSPPRIAINPHRDKSAWPGNRQGSGGVRRRDHRGHLVVNCRYERLDITGLTGITATQHCRPSTRGGRVQVFSRSSPAAVVCDTRAG
jgi:hypothetical protein